MTDDGPAPAGPRIRRLRGNSSSTARPALPWRWRLVSAFGGTALFAGTAVLLAQERLSRTWSRESHAGDGAALLSQAGMLVEEGRTFALVVLMALVVLVAVVASASFKTGGRLHLFLMSFALCCVCTFAVNVAMRAAGAALG